MLLISCCHVKTLLHGAFKYSYTILDLLCVGMEVESYGSLKCQEGSFSFGVVFEIFSHTF